MMGPLLADLASTTVCYFKVPGNAGDALIHQGTLAAFERAGVRRERVEVNDDVAGRVVVIGGGGNLTPLYDHADIAFRNFLEADASRIVVLPHGIRGRDATLSLAREQDVIMCRDRIAYDHVRNTANRATVGLAHDMAFHLDAERFVHDKHITAVARPAIEARLAEHGWSLAAIARRDRMTFTRIDTERTDAAPTTDIDISHQLMHGESDEALAIEAWGLLMCIRQSRRIVTDRLHVAIGAALLGVPANLLANSYDKNISVHEMSLHAFPNIAFGTSA